MEGRGGRPSVARSRGCEPPRTPASGTARLEVSLEGERQTQRPHGTGKMRTEEQGRVSVSGLISSFCSLIIHYLNFYMFICVYAYGYTHVCIPPHVRGGQRATCRGWVVPFNLAGPRNRTQAVSGRCLLPLSCLASPHSVFLSTYCVPGMGLGPGNATVMNTLPV